MSILDSEPLVSIGVPIYNGERHVRQALDSLLAQDYGNLKLTIDGAPIDCYTKIVVRSLSLSFTNYAGERVPSGKCQARGF